MQLHLLLQNRSLTETVDAADDCVHKLADVSLVTFGIPPRLRGETSTVGSLFLAEFNVLWIGLKKTHEKLCTIVQRPDGAGADDSTATMSMVNSVGLRRKFP